MYTTNFKEWLASNEPTDIGDAYDLWKTLHGEPMGGYDASRKGNKVFIKAVATGDTLQLLSQKAIDAFDRQLDSYNDTDMDWEGAYEFWRQMQKDDRPLTLPQAQRVEIPRDSLIA